MSDELVVSDAPPAAHASSDVSHDDPPPPALTEDATESKPVETETPEDAPEDSPEDAPTGAVKEPLTEDVTAFEPECETEFEPDAAAETEDQSDCDEALEKLLLESDAARLASLYGLADDTPENQINALASLLGVTERATPRETADAILALVG